MTEFYLASSSPRRVDILRSVGAVFSAKGVDIDESRHSGESAQDMVLRLAASKASVAAGHTDLPVLGADTTVTVDGQVLGKPVSREDALQMLHLLSARTHEVMTGVALQWDGKLYSDISVTRVTFRVIPKAEAIEYWESGEPLDKAGAYAIQGRGGVFVSRLDGSYSGVVGLPIFETAQLFARADLQLVAAGKTRSP